MKDNNLTANGNGNIQVSGDHNNITLPYPHRSLPRSHIYKLLQYVYRSQPISNDEFSTKLPVTIPEKLRFNHAPRYKNLIENHLEDYSRIDEGMIEFPNSELITTHLHDLFIESVDSFDEDGNPVAENGDERLAKIKDELVATIENDPDYNAGEYYLEEIDRFCIGLMACGIARCKILVRPDE